MLEISKYSDFKREAKLNIEETIKGNKVVAKLIYNNRDNCIKPNTEYKVKYKLIINPLDYNNNKSSLLITTWKYDSDLEIRKKTKLIELDTDELMLNNISKIDLSKSVFDIVTELINDFINRD